MKQLLIKCMLIAFSALGCTYADAKEDIKNEIKEIVSELKSLQQDKLKFTTKDFSSFVQNIQNISPEMTPEEIEKLTALMKIASKSLDFEKCIEIRDTIAALKRKLKNGR